MNDLRLYKGVVLDAIEELREEDETWGWSLKGITKSRVVIRWGYLDYIEQKGNFEITLDVDGDDVRLLGNMNNEHDWSEDEDHDQLFCWIGRKHWHDARTIDEGLRSLIHFIGFLAHSRY